MPAPIALFAFNRPAHLARAVASLRVNRFADTSDLWVFCDGPRRREDEAAVEEVREIAAGISGFGSVHVVGRSENAGLAASVMSGVTQLCESAGRVIVVEDDHVLAPHFLGFVNEALDRYVDHDQAMQVTGYMFPGVSAGLPECFFTRLSSSWGWGTWHRAWQKMDADAASLLSRVVERGLGPSMDLDTSSGYLEMLRSQVAGRIDSWAIRWYASMVLANGLALRPARSLVRNAGMDGSGIHCNPTDAFDVDLAQDPVRHLPELVKEHAAGVAAIQGYFGVRRQSLVRRAWRRVLSGATAARRKPA